MARPTFQFRLTIGAKLVGLIALLLLGSITAIVYQSTEMYVKNDKENIRVSNVEATENLAVQTQEVFGNITEKMGLLGRLMLQDNPQSQQMIQELLDKDKNFLGMVLEKNEGGVTLTAAARAWGSAMSITGDTDGSKALTAIAAQSSFSVPQLVKGEAQIVPIKLADGSAAIAVAIPLVQSTTDPGSFSYAATAFIRPNGLSKMFAENPRGSSYLVDRAGTVLAHTDSNLVGENFSQLPVVQEFLSGTKSQNLVSYVDPVSKESRLSSFRAVGFAGLGVVAEVPEALAYQAATTMERRAVLVGLIILFISFWSGYMYSGTITRPIRMLVGAAQRIASGDFKINLKINGQDEVARLSGAFNEMAKGLEERDRVKATFNKFHNKEIAEKLLSGEVNLGGERKEATIFFSDVRGFTAMTEPMQPEEVVEMLNEYMTRMVAVVRQHHGIVDKYVGDAIMALWGVPIGGGHDAYNAIHAALKMRVELAKLNELRISRGQVPLRIGMGINAGPVIAGNIGSQEKMEYTVIGNTVNIASRVESITKEYGTDLLIPKVVYEKVQKLFVFEKCESALVKGKTDHLEIYKVLGYITKAGKEVIIETPYSSYTPEKSDKSVHHAPAERKAA